MLRIILLAQCNQTNIGKNRIENIKVYKSLELLSRGSFVDEFLLRQLNQTKRTREAIVWLDIFLLLCK